MKLYTLLVVFGVIVTLPILSSGYSSLLTSLPDKGERFGCATCHLSSMGGGELNPFGKDWADIAKPKGDRYVSEIAARDSDGDGFTNDEEFGAGTNPGDPTSHPEVGVRAQTWGRIKAALAR